MLYTANSLPPEKYFMPPTKQIETRCVLTPRVVPGRDTEKHLFSADTDKLFDGKKQTSAQPCSVDIELQSFYAMNGQELKYPVLIPPMTSIIGRSGLKYFHNDDTILLCADTKSKMARKGFFCTGFYMNDDIKSFCEISSELYFVMKNFTYNTLLINGPSSLVQVAETKTCKTDMPLTSFKLIKRNTGLELDVTEDNFVRIGNFIAYVTHLSGEKGFMYQDTVSKPLDVSTDDIERISHIADLKELPRIRPGFCLTMTEEEVHTNGCPAYMYPFHYLNAYDDTSLLKHTSLLDLWVQWLFNDDTNQRPQMIVTGNAGIINPPTNGRVVCENVSQGKDLNRYFRPEKPFALVIPIPFSNEVLDTTTYQGNHLNQQEIGF